MFFPLFATLDLTCYVRTLRRFVKPFLVVFSDVLRRIIFTLEKFWGNDVSLIKVDVGVSVIDNPTTQNFHRKFVVNIRRSVRAMPGDSVRGFDSFKPE